MRSPLPATLILACLAAALASAQGPELRLGAPPGLVSGTVVQASARIAAGGADVLSWSLSLFHEGFLVLEATTAGTDFDRLARGGYAESGVHPEGTACYSVAVLSFTEPVVLPAAPQEVLRMRYLVSRRDPGKARIVPLDGLTVPGDDRQFTNAVLLRGGEAAPLAATEAAFPVTGCAGFAFAAAGSAPGEAPAPIEVRRGTEIEARAFVRVASPEHLDPAGFTLGAAHDPGVLALEAAELDPTLLARYVKADGFARLELHGGGFAAAVLSSTSDPASLGPGDHVAVRARYRFAGRGEPRETISTVVYLADELTLGGSPARSAFQPRDALPCEAARLPLALVVGPHHWLRGDGSSDGAVDISDAILALGYLFLGGRAECLRAMEVNLDGRVDITDPIALLAHLFLGAPPPPPPFPTCGAAEETLPCERFPCPAT